jgi:hypothetical protein
MSATRRHRLRNTLKYEMCRTVRDNEAAIITAQPPLQTAEGVQWPGKVLKDVNGGGSIWFQAATGILSGATPGHVNHRCR